MGKDGDFKAVKAGNQKVKKQKLTCTKDTSLSKSIGAEREREAGTQSDRDVCIYFRLFD